MKKSSFIILLVLPLLTSCDDPDGIGNKTIGGILQGVSQASGLPKLQPYQPAIGQVGQAFIDNGEKLAHQPSVQTSSQEQVPLCPVNGCQDNAPDSPQYEEVHILARKNIATLAGLEGKRIVVGNEDNLSKFTAFKIFSMLNVKPAQIYETDSPHGIIAVLDNDIDAVVIVGTKPLRIFKNMEELKNISTGPNVGKLEQVHFLPIKDARLLKRYKKASLTHNDYDYIAEDVPTIVVKQGLE